MDAQTAYQFLKPSLDKMSEAQKREFRKLIGEEVIVSKPKRKIDPIISKAEIKRRLMKIHFKNRN